MKVENLKSKNPEFRNSPKEIELKKSLTILAGANGYGKSTLIQAIEDSVKEKYKGDYYGDIIKIDPTTNPSNIIDSTPKNYWSKQPKAIVASFDGYSTNDFHYMIGVAMSVHYMSMNRFKYSEGQLRLLDLKRLLELVKLAYKSFEDVPIFVFLDAVDSGLSPDLALKLREIIDSELQELYFKDTVKIVMTSNTFEVVSNVDDKIVDVVNAKTYQRLSFSTYEEYVNFCKKTSTYDDIVETEIYKILEEGK